MTIKYENYSLELDKGRYNLYKTITRNKIGEDKKPTGETYEHQEVVGYGYHLENAIRRIIDDKLEGMSGTQTLRSFIDIYKEEVDIIHKTINL